MKVGSWAAEGVNRAQRCSLLDPKTDGHRRCPETGTRCCGGGRAMVVRVGYYLGERGSVPGGCGGGISS